MSILFDLSVSCYLQFLTDLVALAEALLPLLDLVALVDFAVALVFLVVAIVSHSPYNID